MKKKKDLIPYTTKLLHVSLVLERGEKEREATGVISCGRLDRQKEKRYPLEHYSMRYAAN